MFTPDYIPLEMQYKLAAGRINGLTYKMTDCHWTYEHMVKEKGKCEKMLEGLSGLFMFEIIIRLNKKGLEHMMYHLWHTWKNPEIGIWEYRKLDKQLKDLYAKRNYTLPQQRGLRSTISAGTN